MNVCMVLASCPCLDFGALILIQLSKFNFILLHSKNSGLNLEKIIIFYFLFLPKENSENYMHVCERGC
jgi:hypothetical protein